MVPFKPGDEQQAALRQYGRDLVSLLDGVSDDQLLTVWSMILTYSERVKKLHGRDAVHCDLYHVLIGSTYPIGKTPMHFDFSGGDSALLFLEELCHTFIPSRLQQVKRPW